MPSKKISNSTQDSDITDVVITDFTDPDKEGVSNMRLKKDIDGDIDGDITQRTVATEEYYAESREFIESLLREAGGADTGTPDENSEALKKAPEQDANVATGRKAEADIELKPGDQIVLERLVSRVLPGIEPPSFMMGRIPEKREDFLKTEKQASATDKLPKFYFYDVGRGVRDAILLNRSAADINTIIRSCITHITDSVRSGGFEGAFLTFSLPVDEHSLQSMPPVILGDEGLAKEASSVSKSDDGNADTELFRGLSEAYRKKLLDADDKSEDLESLIGVTRNRIMQMSTESQRNEGLPGVTYIIDKKLGAGEFGITISCKGEKHDYCVKLRSANSSTIIQDLPGFAEVTQNNRHLMSYLSTVEIDPCQISLAGLDGKADICEKMPLDVIPLSAYLNSRKINIYWFLKSVLMPVLEGAGDLHAHGWVHRDIKPGNIFISEEGPDKYCALGDYDLVFRSGSKPEEGFAAGTLCYMSPEQLRAVHITTKSDIYSFGRWLLDLFSEKNQKNSDDIYKKPTVKTFSNEILDVMEGRLNADGLTNIPDTLKCLINRCLDRDPDKRPDVKELKNLLGEFLETDEARRLSIVLLHETYNDDADTIKETPLDKEEVTMKVTPINDEAVIDLRFSGLRRAIRIIRMIMLYSLIGISAAAIVKECGGRSGKNCGISNKAWGRVKDYVKRVYDHDTQKNKSSVTFGRAAE